MAQVKWHGGRMPKSPSAITWFRRRRSVLDWRAWVKAASEARELRIGGCLHYVVAWVIGRGHGFFSVASRDDKVLLSDY